MSVIIGIDPGFSGGIAFWWPTGRVLRVYDMPTVPNTKGKTELDLHTLHYLLEPEDERRNVAVVEQVGAMRGQGVTSMFRFGQGFGAIQMALAAHKIETHYVTPAKWKKHFGLSSDKGVSRGLVMQRLPHYAKHFERVKDDGKAEATLLAMYGYEVLNID